jgi:hypothetical protein
VPPVATELSVEHGRPVNGLVAVDGVGSKPLGNAGDTVTSGPVGNVSGALGFRFCAGAVAEFSAAKPASRQRSLDHFPIIGLPNPSPLRVLLCRRSKGTVGIRSKIVRPNAEGVP